jgi:hypothetical protein
MPREMMVGGEHIVGHARHHDYDELMELSGDAGPARPPQQAPPSPHPPPQLPPPAPPPPVPHHGHHHHHHHGHYPPEYYAYQEPTRRRIVAEEPTHERQFPIGFALENIPPNQEEDIEVKPQVYFRGERLALPPTIARFFDILDIKVGKDSQLAATGAMPGESFSALSVGVRMELDTAKPGIVITLRVKNVDTVAHDFKAVMYGAVLE